MMIVYGLIACLLGGFSTFNLFAISFNGLPWQYPAAILSIVAVSSGLVGRFVQPWRILISCFLLPHLPLFALLIMGSMEKGSWSINLTFIVLISAAICLPAFVSAHFFRRKKNS